MNKDVRLDSIMNEHKCGRAIVFANDPATIRHLYRFFSERGLRPVTLTQERSKTDRRVAMEEFSKAEGGAKVLLTTDVAARGLDVPDVGWVFHYELPPSEQAYVHRAGRTGRVGKQGCSVILISEKNKSVLARFSRQLGIDITPLGKRRR